MGPVSLCRIRGGCVEYREGVLEKRPARVCAYSYLHPTYVTNQYYIQTFKVIFISPSSYEPFVDNAGDAISSVQVTKRTKTVKHSTRPNVAKKCRLDRHVTPRAIAYAAVQVCFFVSPLPLSLTPSASSLSYRRFTLDTQLEWI